MKTGDDNSVLEKVDLASTEVAFALKKEEGTPNLGVYIPTLMSEIEMGENPWERTENLNNNMIINREKTFTFDSINLCNYYTITPYDPAVYYAETELGEQLRIKFLDNDVKQCYFYDDTYKMTDSLKEETIDLNERVALLEEEISGLRSIISNLQNQINQLRGMIK